MLNTTCYEILFELRDSKHVSILTARSVNDLLTVPELSVIAPSAMYKANLILCP